VSFGTADYKNTIKTYGSNPRKHFITYSTLIYCDPPYQGRKQYGAEKSAEWYNEFWKLMEDKSSDAIVVVSEESAPPPWKCVWEQEVSRSIKAKDKSRSTEKLFMLNA